MASDEELLAARWAVWEVLRGHVVNAVQHPLWSCGPNPSTGDDTHVIIGTHRWKVILADMGEITEK